MLARAAIRVADPAVRKGNTSMCTKLGRIYSLDENWCTHFEFIFKCI